MSEASAVLVLLFARNEATRHLMDKLLHQIQLGVNKTSSLPTPPVVYCLYVRQSTEGRQFKITKDSLKFDLDVLRAFPADSHVQSGTLEEQVAAIAKTVVLPESGPVHVIVGAHGAAAVGFGFRFLTLMIRLLFSSFSTEHRRRNWRSRLEYLKNQIFGTAPGFFPLGDTLPALALDGLAAGLKELRRPTTPETPVRPNALMIHACNMSGVECIKSLEFSEFQIAIENQISDTIMFKEAFCGLGSPSAKAEEITRQFLEHLPSDVYVSSHRSDSQPLIGALNTLGKQLRGLASPTEMKSAIRSSRSKSLVGPNTVDLVRFCQILIGQLPALESEIRTVLSNVGDLQIQNRKMPIVGSGHAEYACISIYLPDQGPTSQLPYSFRLSASDWCEFATSWYL